MDENWNSKFENIFTKSWLQTHHPSILERHLWLYLLGMLTILPLISICAIGMRLVLDTRRCLSQNIVIVVPIRPEWSLKAVQTCWHNSSHIYSKWGAWLGAYRGFWQVCASSLFLSLVLDAALMLLFQHDFSRWIEFCCLLRVLL